MQLSIKKLRVILSFALLIEARSITPKIIKISGLLLKPVPSFLKSVHAWIPATAGVLTTHALSGATTEVKSTQGNSISIKAGENLTYQFYTSRYTAGSYSISNLPNGLNYDGRNTISGIISEAGTYDIQIIGYRGGGQNGSSTPKFSLEVIVISDDADGDGIDDSYDLFPNDPNRASGDDFDSDGMDDEFDPDDDNDGIIDTSDAYPKNSLRASGDDFDSDGKDDEFDADDDNDGIDDIDDNDFDNDGVINEADKYTYDPKRASGIDYDGDGTDDEFDSDDDNDGVDDIDDAYPQNSIRASGNDSDGDGIDNEFDSDKTIHAYFSEITDLSNNWYQAWWGIFYIPKSGNWVFHSHLGWLYALPSAQDTLWLHDEDLGWLYTTKTLDRFFYRNSTGGWLYHLAKSKKSRFWDYSQEIELE